MKMLEKFRDCLGIGKHSDYINRYFDESNLKSGIYVSSVVILLELFMIASVVIRQLLPGTKRSADWFLIHIGCYVALLCSALALFIYSVCHIKKLSSNRKCWEVLKYIFSIVSIAFGIYISYTDYLKGEQFITLMTMTIFVFSFVVWRPLFSIIFLCGSYLIFFHCLPSLTFVGTVQLTALFDIFQRRSARQYLTWPQCSFVSLQMMYSPFRDS